MRLWTAGMLLLGALSQAQAEEYSKSYSVSGRAAVHVHVDDSRVRVVTSDTQQVDFNVRREGTSGLSLGNALKINSNQDGDNVEISVLHQPGIAIGFTDHHLITEVHMPRDADLQIETRDGRVDLASVNGNVTVHSTDGAINASQLTGKIELQSVDGAINADTFKGDVRLHSTDGAITVTHFDGQCDVSEHGRRAACRGSIRRTQARDDRRKRGCQGGRGLEDDVRLDHSDGGWQPGRVTPAGLPGQHQCEHPGRAHPARRAGDGSGGDQQVEGARDIERRWT